VLVDTPTKPKPTAKLTKEKPPLSEDEVSQPVNPHPPATAARGGGESGKPVGTSSKPAAYQQQQPAKPSASKQAPNDRSQQRRSGKRSEHVFSPAIASHGERALSLHLFIKQPRAGSLELDIVHQLGGASHIPAALPITNLLVQCNLLDGSDDEDTYDSPMSTESVSLPPLKSVLVLPYVCIIWKGDRSLSCSLTHMRRFLQNRRAQSMDELRVMGRHLGEALRYLHGAGYVHRDVKRPNVRFTGDEAFLIDFDIAAKWRHGDPLLRGKAGTPQWRAPEVEAEHGYGSHADMYGLGLVLFEEALVITKSSIRGALLFYCSPPLKFDCLLASPVAVQCLCMDSFQPGHVITMLQHYAPPLAVDAIYHLLGHDFWLRPTAGEFLEMPWFSLK
jgi:serine/threonine protein kinase